MTLNDDIDEKFRHRYDCPSVHWDDLRRWICRSFIWIQFAMVNRLYIVSVPFKRDHNLKIEKKNMHKMEAFGLWRTIPI